MGVSGRHPDCFTPNKEPLYPLNRRLGGPHSQSGRLPEDKNRQPLPEFETGSVQPVPSHYTDRATPALKEIQQLQSATNTHMNDITSTPVLLQKTTNWSDHNCVYAGFSLELLIYNRTRLCRHRFMRHLVYSVRYSVVPINSSLLTTTLYSSVITTPVYNDTKYSVPFMTL
jgi:hypothetical protein